MSQGVDGIKVRRPAVDGVAASARARGHAVEPRFGWVELLGSVLAVLLFYGFKMLTGHLSPVAGLGVAVLLGLLLRDARYADTSRALAVVLRVLVVATTAYILQTHPYYISDGEVGGAHEAWAQLLDFAWLPSVAFGALALVRPMFALLPMTYLVVLKDGLSTSSGLPLSQTDYAIIPESALLALFAVGLAWLAKQRGLLRGRSLQGFGDQVFYLVVAIHFANYFYAGYQKVVLDGPLLSWLTNQTQNIFYNSLVYKTNPLGAWDVGASALAALLENSVLLTNSLVLVFQLGSLLAIARRSLIVLFAVFYDLMHLAIFLATGIFFWKWIILNLAIIVAARRLSFQVPSKTLLAFGMVALLLSPLAFYIPRLGWYDSKELNRTTIRAVLEDGSKLELPSNFFRNYSVIFAQNRIARASAKRLPTGAFGATWRYQDYLDSLDCNNDLLPAASGDQQAKLLAGLRRFISGYHNFALRQTDPGGRHSYDYFPHHIWSNPLQYRQVSKLDLTTVTAYELVIEGICVSGTDNAPDLELVSRTRTIFPIPVGS